MPSKLFDVRNDKLHEVDDLTDRAAHSWGATATNDRTSIAGIVSPTTAATAALSLAVVGHVATAPAAPRWNNGCTGTGVPAAVVLLPWLLVDCVHLSAPTRRR